MGDLDTFKGVVKAKLKMQKNIIANLPTAY
jgi:hypothetical protein